MKRNQYVFTITEKLSKEERNNKIKNELAKHISNLKDHYVYIEDTKAIEDKKWLVVLKENVESFKAKVSPFKYVAHVVVSYNDVFLNYFNANSELVIMEVENRVGKYNKNERLFYHFDKVKLFSNNG